MKKQQGQGYFLPSWVMPEDGAAIDMQQLGNLLWAMYEENADNLRDVMRLVGMRWLTDEYTYPVDCHCGAMYRPDGTELHDDVFEEGVQARYRRFTCERGHTVTQRMTSSEQYDYDKEQQALQN